MPSLPNTFSIQMGIGSQWTQSYTFQNSDGSLLDLTGKIFEFVVRNDPGELSSVIPVIKATSAGTAQGSISVNTTTATITVTLLPVGTAAMSQKTYYYSLWMNQGLTDATAWVTGTVFAALIANP